MNELYLKNKKIKAILFDFDGTLLDSFSVHFEVYKITFKHFGIELDKKAFLNTYSPDWYKTYEAIGLPKNKWKQADDFWVKEAVKYKPELFSCATEILNKLKKRFVLGLVTSGSKKRVIKDLERTGINNLFKTVITGDDVKNPKPSPEGLLLALNELKLKSYETIYIGDSNADYQMAMIAGIYFIGIISDFSTLRGNNPSCNWYKIEEIPNLFGL